MVTILIEFFFRVQKIVPKILENGKGRKRLIDRCIICVFLVYRYTTYIKRYHQNEAVLKRLVLYIIYIFYANYMYALYMYYVMQFNTFKIYIHIYTLYAFEYFVYVFNVYMEWEKMVCVVGKLSWAFGKNVCFQCSSIICTVCNYMYIFISFLNRNKFFLKKYKIKDIAAYWQTSWSKIHV